MTMDERIEAAARTTGWYDALNEREKADARSRIGVMFAAAFPELSGDKPTHWLAPMEPDTAMKRAIIKDRGYDPDAKEETLDALGRMDLATMGESFRKYGVMRDAYLGKGDGG